MISSVHISSGHYVAAIARTAEELDLVFRLRYDVFNRELGEGLETSHVTQRDVDRFDTSCHHLVVRDQISGRIVGTYRMQTRAMAASHQGFYSATEFDLGCLPEAILREALELGRACIAKDHRSSRVLYLLWRGVLQYMLSHELRYGFGCCSLTSQDPHEAKRVMDWLEHHGCLHPTWRVMPQADYRCYAAGFQADPGPLPKRRFPG